MRNADQQSPTRKSSEAPSLAAELAVLGRSLRSLFDPYRPERHYMRGPGPKWHAKHNPAPVNVEASAIPALVAAHAALAARGIPRAAVSA
jgi:hypothetical protein